MTEPSELPLGEARRLLDAGALSALELTASCLARIEDHDGEIGAFARVFADEALARAAELDASQPRGALHGIPVAVKDLIDVAGHPTEAGSPAYAGRLSSGDAAVVSMLRQAGAIIIGKTNTHELAFGVSTPAARNPWSLDRMTGGSSGGSAAALAAGMVPAALGTDTGGSVRNPSSYCGTVGLKTTPGLVSRDGLFMLSTRYDVIGPMTRNCADARRLLSAMVGTRAIGRLDDRGASATEILVGLPAAPFYEGMNLAPEVEAAYQNKVEQLMTIGASMREVSPPSHTEHSGPGSVIVAAEALHQHRRVLTETPELISEDIFGFISLADGLAAAELAAAHAAVSGLQRRWLNIFDDVDFVICPVTPNHVPPHGLSELAGVPLIPATTPLTFPINGAGLAALAIPDGPAGDGLPVGVQIIGPSGSDLRLLALAEQLERQGLMSAPLAIVGGNTG